MAALDDSAAAVNAQAENDPSRSVLLPFSLKTLVGKFNCVFNANILLLEVYKKKSSDDELAFEQVWVKT